MVLWPKNEIAQKHQCRHAHTSLVWVSNNRQTKVRPFIHPIILVGLQQIDQTFYIQRHPRTKIQFPSVSLSELLGWDLVRFLGGHWFWLCQLIPRTWQGKPAGVGLGVKEKKTMPSLNQLALKTNSAVSLAASDGALYIKMVSQGLSLKTDCLITSLQDSLAILANRLG